MPVGSKAQRLASVIGAIDNGQCFLPDGASYLDVYVDEFPTFPGRHDDVRDATVWCLLALATGGAADWSGATKFMEQVATAPPSPLGEHEFSFGRAAQMFAAPTPPTRSPSPDCRERSAAAWARRGADARVSAGGSTAAVDVSRTDGSAIRRRARSAG